MTKKLTIEEQYNQFLGFLDFKKTWIFTQFMLCPHKILGLFYGNRAGKTAGTARSYVIRILGRHPIPRKNMIYFICKNKHEIGPGYVMDSRSDVCPQVDEEGKPCCGEKLELRTRQDRVFRFSSANKPMQGDDKKRGEVINVSSEVKNTQYPAFKRWLPPILLLKDCTQRAAQQTILDPVASQLGLNLPPIVVEYTSYHQALTSKQGQGRVSVWMDEQCGEEEWIENKRRVVSERGDIIITNTPVDYMSYLYDEVFERAQTYYRTQKIVDHYKRKYNQNLARVEETGRETKIGVFCASTYDNPMIDAEEVADMLAGTDDPDVADISVYGEFKQISGRIFKSFSYKTHVIDGSQYFEEAA